MSFPTPYQSYKHKILSCSIWLLCLMAYSSACGQTEDFIFKNYTERDGLCDNIVFSLLKDKNNILWVGTQNGLSRFDGNNFHNFKQKKNGNSIPNNTIHSLCEDLNGNIWGGTEAGLFCFDTRTNQFSHYNAPKGCFNNLINNVICDQKGNIYATTYIELVRFDRKSNKLELIAPLSNDLSNPNAINTSKNCLVKDEITNTLWITTSSGLLFFDLNKNKLQRVAGSGTDDIFKNRICRAITHYKNGKIMFADNSKNEIVIFDPVQKKIVEIIPLGWYQENAYVSTILLDNQDKLWITCFNHKIVLIDLKRTKHIDNITHHKDRNYSITSEFFWDALMDSNGSVWLGTLNGISVCSPKIPAFMALRIPEVIKELKTDIQLIKEDPQTLNLWMVTNDRKVIQYDAKTKNYSIFDINDFVPNDNKEIPNFIESIYFLNSRILLTSYTGAWEHVSRQNKWIPLNLLPKKHKSFPIKNILSIDSLIYVSDGLDILQYNPYSQLVKIIYDNDKDGPKEDTPIQIENLYADSHKRLYWVGFMKYIGSYHKGKVRLIELLGNNSGKNVGYFSTSIMDEKDRLWIGFKGFGLVCYNTNTQKLKSWTEFDGWINNHVHKIIIDKAGNIWTMYYNKVSCFDPNKESFINFSIPYSENKLSYANSLIQRKDGSILGVVGNDIFKLNAQHLSQSPLVNFPGLTSVSIADQTHFISSDTTLYLEPNENSIVFKYGLLTDPLAYPHYFEYRLTGFEKTWKTAESVYQAGYNHLPPGQYTFEVVARGRNNDWVSQPNKISFVIKTPFYKTTLFYIVLASTILILLFLFYKYRIAQYNKVMNLESKAQLLEKEKAQVMYDGLKQQLNPHFLFNSLTSLSALIENDQELASQFLSQMSDMYRYILKNANEEAVPLQDELNFVDTYVALQKTRFGKGLLVNISVPPQLGTKKIAPVTLQNMLENAIKHNVIDSDSPLIVDIYVEDNYLVVKNNVQAKNNVETSNKRGLVQFLSLYRYLSPMPVVIDQTESHFIIKIPLI
ncbi:MAG: histidine kinase [Saprospiraceae bacterium]|nr:histidine kinase [Saprospiraceae bacterium]